MLRIHEFFEKNADLYANTLALQVSDSEMLSYQELNQQANQLARCLVNSCHLAQGDRVVMLVPRSAHQVTIFLALSKVGAIYIPLDSNCPDERIYIILEDINPQCIIMSSQTHSSLYKGMQQRDISIFDVSFLDNSKDFLSSFPNHNLSATLSNENNIAYIIYTSGTTGRPKGVPVKHTGFVYWKGIIQRQFNKNYTEKVLAYISTGFDAHIWEYLMAWLTHSTLCLVGDDARSDIHVLKEYIIKHQVTHATLIPTTLVNMDLDTFLPSTALKTIYSTGEACTLNIIQACERSGIRLFNAYGPTEATFGISLIECTVKSFDARYGAPIGHPESGVQIHILDENFQKVPNQQEGELFIESDYLTPGYWNREDETKKRFKMLNNRRLYATGDLFCVDAEGILRYCGRKSLDTQVKIRGQMVNLYEVETLLQSIPGIQHACIIVIEQHNNPFLIGYYAETASALTKQYIKNRLSKFLLPAAVPAKLIKLLSSEFPVTSNNKVDRQYLINHYNQYQNMASQPNLITPLHQKLMNMLYRIFKITSMTEEDTFFTLGGDSLSLAEFLKDIEKEWHISIPLASCYSQDLTLSALTNLIHQHKWQKEKRVPNLIHGGQSNLNVFMIHPITGEAPMTYLSLSIQLSDTVGVNVYGISARGLTDPEDISQDMTTIAEDYAHSIEVFQPAGPYILIGWSWGGGAAWKVTDILESRGHKVSLIVLDSICPWVYQHSHQSLFAENLLDTVNKICEIADIISVNLPELKQIEHSPHIEQIAYVFETLCKSPQNSAKKNFLLLIASLMTAYQQFKPKQLTSKVFIVRCHETVRTVLKMSHFNEAIENSLGWSQTKTYYSSSSNPLICPHLSMLRNKVSLREIETIITLIKQKRNNDSHLDSSNMEYHELQTALRQANEQISKLTEELEQLKQQFNQNQPSHVNTPSVSSSDFWKKSDDVRLTWQEQNLNHKGSNYRK